jgi:hypothetical protein
MGLGSFEPVGSGAKTLRRCPVGLQLRHLKNSSTFSLFKPMPEDKGF